MNVGKSLSRERYYIYSGLPLYPSFVDGFSCMSNKSIQIEIVCKIFYKILIENNSIDFPFFS